MGSYVWIMVMNKNFTGTQLVGLEVLYLEHALNTIVVRQGIQTLISNL